MKMKKIFIIIGKTMSGKTTIMEKIEDVSTFKKIISHTTRPKRFPEEDGYYFEDNFINGDNILALRTYYPFISEKNKKSTWQYWLDKNDIENVKYPFLITDVVGCCEIVKKYGEKNVTVINVVVSKEEQIRRIEDRSFKEETLRRIEADEIAYKNVKSDYTINTGEKYSLDKNIIRVKNIIEKEIGSSFATSSFSKQIFISNGYENWKKNSGKNGSNSRKH